VLLRPDVPVLWPRVGWAGWLAHESLPLGPPAAGPKDLPDVLSANLSLDAWTPTPAALVVHGPVSSHKTSAFPTLGTGRRSASPCQATSRPVPDFGAAVIRFASGLQMCWPPRSLPPMQLNAAWQPWLLRPSTVEFVTSLHVGYASRPNRATDGRGLSPPRFAALSAAPLTWA
jgi:hypothetical protein